MNQRNHNPEILSSIKHLIVDMDGVLYRGGERLPGARQFLSYLVETEVPFVLATNNSTLTTQQYVSKLAAMDITIDELTEEQRHYLSSWEEGT